MTAVPISSGSHWDVPMPARARKGRRGRPSRLTDATQEAILAALSTWHHLDTAAALAGVHRDSVHDWLTTGARLRDRIESGAIRRADLTDHERREVDFSDAVREAIAFAKHAGLGIIAGAATEPTIETRTVEKVVGVDSEGEPIRVTETTTITKPPTWQPMAWLMERRFAEDFSAKVVGIGEDGSIPINVRIASVIQAVEQHKSQGLRALPDPQPEENE